LASGTENKQKRRHGNLRPGDLDATLTKELVDGVDVFDGALRSLRRAAE
jgi:hypothetical protein